MHHLQLHFPDRAGVALAQQMRSTEGKWLIFAPKAGAVMQLPEFCGFSGAAIVIELDDLCHNGLLLHWQFAEMLLVGGFLLAENSSFSKALYNLDLPYKKANRTRASDLRELIQEIIDDLDLGDHYGGQ